MRLLTGMVRANRPGRALLGLSKLLVGVFGTAAVSLINSTIRQVGDALDGLRPAQDSLIVPRDQCGDDFVWQTGPDECPELVLLLAQLVASQVTAAPQVPAGVWPCDRLLSASIAGHADPVCAHTVVERRSSRTEARRYR